MLMYIFQAYSMPELYTGRQVREQKHKPAPEKQCEAKTRPKNDRKLGQI